MESTLTPTHLKSHFTLKGSLCTLTTMILESDDLEGIAHQLTQVSRQAPKFFDHTPMVIDLKKCPEIKDLSAILACLREFHLIPVGIRATQTQIQQQAFAAGLAIFPEEKKAETPASPMPSMKNKTKIITQPVRSGQQIYAQNSDLVIIASYCGMAATEAPDHNPTVVFVDDKNQVKEIRAERKH